MIVNAVLTTLNLSNVRQTFVARSLSFSQLDRMGGNDNQFWLVSNFSVLSTWARGDWSFLNMNQMVQFVCFIVSSLSRVHCQVFAFILDFVDVVSVRCFICRVRARFHSHVCFQHTNLMYTLKFHNILAKCVINILTPVACLWWHDNARSREIRDLVYTQILIDTYLCIQILW